MEKRFAFTAVITGKGYSIGRADEGVRGYTPKPEFGTFEKWDDAVAVARARNVDLGLTDREAFQIVASTMAKRHVVPVEPITKNEIR